MSDSRRIEEQCRHCNFYPECHLNKRYNCEYFIDQYGSDKKTYFDIVDECYSTTDNSLNELEEFDGFTILEFDDITEEDY